MANKYGQKNGMAAKSGINTFKGEFNRSGQEGQFHHELKTETINFVLDKFPEFKNVYPNLIE